MRFSVFSVNDHHPRLAGTDAEAKAPCKAAYEELSKRERQSAQ